MMEGKLFPPSFFCLFADQGQEPVDLTVTVRYNKLIVTTKTKDVQNAEISPLHHHHSLHHPDGFPVQPSIRRRAFLDFVFLPILFRLDTNTEQKKELALAERMDFVYNG